MRRAGRLSSFSLIWAAIGMLAVPASAYTRPGVTRMVSVALNGQPGSALVAIAGDAPALATISADGRYVAFSSWASDLVPGDVNGIEDVFVRNLRTRTTRRVSVASDGSQALPSGTGFLGGSDTPAISADGRIVTFTSWAANLVPGDTNLTMDVFVHDLTSGSTRRVDVSSTGRQTESKTNTGFSAISADGRYVAFQSDATDLVPRDTNDLGDVFLHDLVTGKTERESVASGGAQAEPPAGQLFNESSGCPSLSATGRYVSFDSGAVNLVQGDTNGIRDVFVHDRKTGTTERVSVASDGSQAMGPPGSGFSLTCGSGGGAAESMSANGRFVTYYSDAYNLVPNDANTDPLNGADVYVFDRKTRRTERVSVSSTGGEGRSWSAVPAISASGRYVAFQSYFNFFPGDEGDFNTQMGPGSGDPDVFVYDRRTGSLDWVSVRSDGGEPHHCPGDPNQNPLYPQSSMSLDPSVSADGRFVAFVSCADDIVAGDSNRFNDTFIHDRGLDLGAGGWMGGPPGASGTTGICVGSVCPPSLGAVSAQDPATDTSSTPSAEGADLIGASVAYRPRLGDLFLRLDLKTMPSVGSADPAVQYGLDLTVGGVRYEVRAQHAAVDLFGLFRAEGGTWKRVTGLHGGLGTTGDEVVVSVPLRDLDLRAGGEVSQVRAFTAIGSYWLGPVRLLDDMRLSPWSLR